MLREGLSLLLARGRFDCRTEDPADFATPLPRKTVTMKTFNVLVLCTHNSARSILGEALFNHLGRGRIQAFSAGSQPSGEVDPLALATLAAHGVPWPGTGVPRSKSWDEFAGPVAPRFDFLFTVCAGAAGEACPVWPGHPATVHWGIPDLARVEPPEARRDAFEAAYNQLAGRIAAFLKLPLETMSTAAIATAAQEIHERALQ